MSHDAPSLAEEEEDGEVHERDPSSPVMDDDAKQKIRVLLGSILLVALCSITYELIIGTVSSYLLGNSVYQFSLTIGLYLSAMGVGSYLSRFIERDILERFFWVELSVGILGGVSSTVLFGVFTFTPYFQPAMWLLTLAIGTLVGLEIPLLTRYVRRYAELRVALANVLSWDYIGSLIGSLAFPLLLLPALGLINSAAIVGMINVSVAILGMLAFRKDLKQQRWLAFGALVGATLLAGIFFTSKTYERFLDRRLFQDPVVYTEQTPYQKLTLTAWRNKDFRLFINGNIQFSSMDEYRYHESLVHVPMAVAKDPKRVLILGGGDGLAVRQLKAYPEVERIVMVDLDPRMTELATTHPVLRRLNEGSMEDDKLTVVHADAMSYLMETDEVFDVVLIDLPDPNNESLAKLYSVSFYRLVRNHLAPTGAMVTQSSAVYYAPRAFWSIHKTIEAAFCPDPGCTKEAPHVIPYHAWVPSFSDWGFNLAARRPLDPKAWSIKVPTKFFDDAQLTVSLNFPPDIAERDVKINRLIEPVLLDYYLSDWRSFNN